MTTSAVRCLLLGARALEHFPTVRHAAFAAAERRARAMSERDPEQLRHPPAVERDKLAVKLALLSTLERALAEHRLGPASLRGFVDVLYKDVLVRRGEPNAKRRFRERFGCGPPAFLVISPSRACNLRCTGCYANAGSEPEALEFDLLDRIVREAKTLWGTRFIVLSGGEPFAYRSGGRGILELAERHADCFFIVYSNGTLIDDSLARRLGALGNLSPGLSIEGGRERTDARRGQGVFDRVVAAAERLRRERAVFGVSLTATRENTGEILSDEVLDLFFGRLGAFYGWLFHYMPMGRAPSLELMLTAEQRVQLWTRLWQVIAERRVFIADFWNSGTVTNGCIAGGRPGGYLHIDWNANVCPCVFAPYSPANLRDVYARGGTLDDVWAEPFFAEIRAWQRSYGYRENGERRGPTRNWLAPCLTRDHHLEFRAMINRHAPRPADASAGEALQDPGYGAGLAAFDAELSARTDPIWNDRYLREATQRGH